MGRALTKPPPSRSQHHSYCLEAFRLFRTLTIVRVGRSSKSLNFWELVNSAEDLNQEVVERLLSARIVLMSAVAVVFASARSSRTGRTDAVAVRAKKKMFLMATILTVGSCFESV
jgi:hypothetical protein